MEYNNEKDLTFNLIKIIIFFGFFKNNFLKILTLRNFEKFSKFKNLKILNVNKRIIIN